MLQSLLARQRVLSRHATRSYSTPTPSPQATEKPNPHREFYRGGLGRAVAFNFLIAMTTFQALYWSWLKLESIEVKKEKGEEVQALEGELKTLVGRDGKN
ncbi:hypothetical protein TI39_contig4175g00019 [Zymoseptoria brevis]|uniref:Uncharacterized protein n=1 Tax=Zymoseptoria brevis TaxID=1047168 RepID=A0A0F4GC27_9PEZI|nr:hypothetical protein TI39_contig4175g00019 [Zymoseptoria brevis]